ncbi:ChbG/HpnK family deacetylase [Candidatus Methylospira mobilis]|nr:ChbG/HpnK family deacetylase [Candidatus Methylospira mobilis]WNV03190.1 ChbG/HpnK family deacetylase [Candidatus Methylospira mobilis]
MARKLLINADDFGFDHDTAAATVALFEKGALTSATIMTGMPASLHAMEYARENGSRFSFGLHFNLVDAHAPMSSSTASLVDADGLFRSSREQRIRALFNLLDSRALADEFECQLRALLDNGVRVTHIDSHGHLHKFPRVVRAIAPVMSKYGIKRIRLPQTLYFRRKMARSLINRYCRSEFDGFETTDNLWAVDEHRAGWFERLLAALPDGVTELAVHPGSIEPWRRIESAPLLDERFHALLKTHATQLVDYREI